MESSGISPDTKGDRVLSATQAGRLLGVQHRELRRLLRRGRIRGHKALEKWEIPLNEVKRWARVRAALRSDDLFTPARAARKLGISRQAVHQKIRDGHLRTRMVGPRRFIPKSALEEELRKRKHEGLWDSTRVSQALGMTRQQVYQLLKSGRLRAERIGYYFFVAANEVHAFMNARSQQP